MSRGRAGGGGEEYVGGGEGKKNLPAVLVHRVNDVNDAVLEDTVSGGVCHHEGCEVVLV